MEDTQQTPKTALKGLSTKNVVGLLALLAFGVVVSLGVLISQRQQIIRESVSPFDPDSQPSAAEVVSQTCSLLINPINRPSPSPSPSPSPTPPVSPTPTPPSGTGEVALKVFNAAAEVITFNFLANISPANAGVLPPSFSVTTSTPLANGLAGYANFATLQPGAVVSYTAQQPPAGYCLVDTGYIVRGGAGGSQFVFTGNACRTITTQVSQAPNSMSIPMYKFDKCATDNWTQTTCTTTLSGQSAGAAAHGVTLTVQNTSSQVREFSVTVNGAPASYDNNAWLRVAPNTTTTYRLLVQSGGGNDVSVNVRARTGSVNVTSLLVDDLKTNARVVNKATMAQPVTTTIINLVNPVVVSPPTGGGR